MSIWAIADIHASRTDALTGRPETPMDVFGAGWADHVERLELAWTTEVDHEDTVIIAGDIDWALHLEDAMETLKRIDSWPGQKILIRGNHDYWWSSKATNKVRKALPPSLHALHNDAVQAEQFNICGTKGSPVPGAIDWTPQDEKLLRREEQRLTASLSQRAAGLPTIAALHYPPFYPAQDGSVYRDVLETSGVGLCVYGHLHGEAASLGPRGMSEGVAYTLVAADAVGFRPVLVAQDGRFVAGSGLQYAG